MKSYSNIIPCIACAVLFTAAAVWPARADYNSTVQSHSPVGYWQFKETGPSPAPHKLANAGSLGAVADAYANATVSSVAGKVNNAAKFVNTVGTGHCDSRANVVYNPALSSSAFSVEFWAQPGAGIFGGAFDGTGACPLSNFNPNNYPGGRVGWLFYLAPTGKWNFRLGLTSGYASGGNVVANSPVATAGVWQHIAVTYDGSTVNLYINGASAVSSPSSAASTGWVPNTGSFLRFGGTPLVGDTEALTADGNYYMPFYLNFTADLGSPTSGNRGWDGLLDEVAIYTNVLSAGTIAAHYAAAANPATYGSTIRADNPVGYWNFDEAPVTPPARSALPILANSGTAGNAADATNEWGAVVAQAGPGYAGFVAGDKAVGFNLAQSSITAKDAPSLHFSGNITLAAWVKPAANNYVHDVIEHGCDGFAAETFLRLSRGYGNGSGQYYEVGTTEGEQGDGWYDSVLYPMPPGDIGNWVFLAGTFDGANWNLYRNGLLVGSIPPYVSSTDQDTGAIDVTNSWTIGSRALPSTWDDHNFAGLIAEPAVFTTALSGSDILALYNAAQVPPVITRAVQVPPGAYKGASATFTVWAEGSPTLNYSWTSNGVPAGINATNVTLNNLTTGNLTVAVAVANAYGTNTSSVTFTVVASKPLITKQPAPVTRFVGLPFQFSVTAAGTVPIYYQWNTNNAPIPGATSSTYTGIVSSATAGSYSCTLSNEAGTSNTISVALTAVPVPPNYPAAVFASGPIAYWRLDETNGSVVAHDLMNGNDGVYNSTTLGVPGYSLLDSDTAASFSGDNSYVGNINGAGAINFPGHPVFTLEAWVNAPAGQNDEATVIAKGIGQTGTSRTEQFSLDVSGGVYRFFTDDSRTTVYDVDATVGPNGSWQHVACVYDDQNVLGGGSNMYIYVNGNLEATRKTRPQGVIDTTSVVSIGSKRTGNDPTYDGTLNGTIDEVAIYNKPLDGATIQAHYAAAYGSSTPPFIAVQPVPTTNYAGLTSTFSVAAAGTQPLTYQWKRNNVDLSDGPTANGSMIAGSSTETLTISALALTDAGTYSVGITNSVNPGIKSISVPLVVLSAPTSPPAIPGLVLHLPFDGNLIDATGRGNNGVSIHSATNPVTGGGYVSNVVAATYVTDGVLGQAFHYSTEAMNTGGTTSEGTNSFYATLGVRPDLQFSTNVSFSVAFWVRLPLGYQGGDLPFFCNAVGSSLNQGFAFAPAYGYGTADPNPTTDPGGWIGCWAFSIFGAGGNPNGILYYGSNLGAFPGSINDGNWHHLVHVFDRQAGTFETYLDGLVNHGFKDAGSTLLGAGNIDSGLPANIGQDPSGLYGETGEADIDDLGVWKKALTSLEAASIYVAAASNHLSYVSAPITLTVQRVSTNQVKFTWPAGMLQSSASLVGTNQTPAPFVDVTPASPYTTYVTNAARAFYRVRL